MIRLAGWQSLVTETGIYHVVPINDLRGVHQLDRDCPCGVKIIPQSYEPRLGCWLKMFDHTAFDGRGDGWWPRAQNAPDS